MFAGAAQSLFPRAAIQALLHSKELKKIQISKMLQSLVALESVERIPESRPSLDRKLTLLGSNSEMLVQPQGRAESTLINGASWIPFSSSGLGWVPPGIQVVVQSISQSSEPEGSSLLAGELRSKGSHKRRWLLHLRWHLCTWSEFLHGCVRGWEAWDGTAAVAVFSITLADWMGSCCTCWETGMYYIANSDNT